MKGERAFGVCRYMGREEGSLFFFFSYLLPHPLSGQHEHVTREKRRDGRSREGESPPPRLKKKIKEKETSEKTLKN